MDSIPPALAAAIKPSLTHGLSLVPLPAPFTVPGPDLPQIMCSLWPCCSGWGLNGSVLVWGDLCVPPGRTQLLSHCQHSLAALHVLLDSLPLH